MMMLVTTDTVPGFRILKVVGLARGNSVRGVHLGGDILASLKNIVGGELEEYTKALAETREQALDRLSEHAQSLGANAVVALRFSSTDISPRAAELLVYGTAVVIEAET
ncbi:MAG: YbjQ family protein [Planctomycetota bacterium]